MWKKHVYSITGSMDDDRTIQRDIIFLDVFVKVKREILENKRKTTQ